MGFTHDWDDLIAKKKVRVAGLTKPPRLGGPVSRFFGQAPMGEKLDRDRADSYEYPHDIKVLDPTNATWRTPWNQEGQKVRENLKDDWGALVEWKQNRFDHARMARMWRDQQADLRERHAKKLPLPPGFAGKKNPGKPSDYIWRTGSSEGFMGGKRHDQFKLYTDKGHHNLGELGQKGPLMTRLAMTLNHWLSFIPGLRDPSARIHAKRKVQKYADAMHILHNHNMNQIVNPGARMASEDRGVVESFISDYYQQHHGMSKTKANLHAQGVSNMADANLANLEVALSDHMMEKIREGTDPEDALSGTMSQDGVKEAVKTYSKKRGESIRTEGVDYGSEFPPVEDEGDGTYPANYNLPEVDYSGKGRYDKDNCGFAKEVFGGPLYYTRDDGSQTHLRPAAMRAVREALIAHKREAHGDAKNHTPGVIPIHEEQDPYEWLTDPNNGFMQSMSKQQKGVRNQVKSALEGLQEQGPQSLDGALGYLLGNEDHILHYQQVSGDRIPNYNPESPSTFFHPPDADITAAPAGTAGINLVSDDEVKSSYDTPIDLAWGILKGV